MDMCHLEDQEDDFWGEPSEPLLDLNLSNDIKAKDEEGDPSGSVHHPLDPNTIFYYIRKNDANSLDKLLINYGALYHLNQVTPSNFNIFQSNNEPLSFSKHVMKAIQPDMMPSNTTQHSVPPNFTSPSFTAATDVGFTPLMVACQYGHLECVRILIEQHQASPFVLDASDKHSFFYAAEHGRYDVVDYLLLTCTGGSSGSHLFEHPNLNIIPTDSGNTLLQTIITHFVMNPAYYTNDVVISSFLAVVPRLLNCKEYLCNFSHRNKKGESIADIVMMFLAGCDTDEGPQQHLSPVISLFKGILWDFQTFYSTVCGHVASILEIITTSDALSKLLSPASMPTHPIPMNSSLVPKDASKKWATLVALLKQPCYRSHIGEMLTCHHLSIHGESDNDSGGPTDMDNDAPQRELSPTHRHGFFMWVIQSYLTQVAQNIHLSSLPPSPLDHSLARGQFFHVSSQPSDSMAFPLSMGCFFVFLSALTDELASAYSTHPVRSATDASHHISPPLPALESPLSTFLQRGWVDPISGRPLAIALVEDDIMDHLQLQIDQFEFRQCTLSVVPEPISAAVQDHSSRLLGRIQQRYILIQQRVKLFYYAACNTTMMKISNPELFSSTMSCMLGYGTSPMFIGDCLISLNARDRLGLTLYDHISSVYNTNIMFGLVSSIYAYFNAVCDIDSLTGESYADKSIWFGDVQKTKIVSMQLQRTVKRAIQSANNTHTQSVSLTGPGPQDPSEEATASSDTAESCAPLGISLPMYHHLPPSRGSPSIYADLRHTATQLHPHDGVLFVLNKSEFNHTHTDQTHQNNDPYHHLAKRTVLFRRFHALNRFFVLHFIGASIGSSSSSTGSIDLPHHILPLVFRYTIDLTGVCSRWKTTQLKQTQLELENMLRLHIRSLAIHTGESSRFIRFISYRQLTESNTAVVLDCNAILKLLVCNDATLHTIIQPGVAYYFDMRSLILSPSSLFAQYPSSIQRQLYHIGALRLSSVLTLPGVPNGDMTVQQTSGSLVGSPRSLPIATSIFAIIRSLASTNEDPLNRYQFLIDNVKFHFDLSELLCSTQMKTSSRQIHFNEDGVRLLNVEQRGITTDLSQMQETTDDEDHQINAKGFQDESLDRYEEEDDTTTVDNTRYLIPPVMLSRMYITSLLDVDLAVKQHGLSSHSQWFLFVLLSAMHIVHYEQSTPLSTPSSGFRSPLHSMGRVILWRLERIAALMKQLQLPSDFPSLIDETQMKHLVQSALTMASSSPDSSTAANKARCTVLGHYMSNLALLESCLLAAYGSPWLHDNIKDIFHYISVMLPHHPWLIRLLHLTAIYAITHHRVNSSGQLQSDHGTYPRHHNAHAQSVAPLVSTSDMTTGGSVSTTITLSPSDYETDLQSLTPWLHIPLDKYTAHAGALGVDASLTRLVTPSRFHSIQQGQDRPTEVHLVEYLISAVPLHLLAPVHWNIDGNTGHGQSSAWIHANGSSDPVDDSFCAVYNTVLKTMRDARKSSPTTHSVVGSHSLTQRPSLLHYHLYQLHQLFPLTGAPVLLWYFRQVYSTWVHSGMETPIDLLIDYNLISWLISIGVDINARDGSDGYNILTYLVTCQPFNRPLLDLFLFLVQQLCAEDNGRKANNSGADVDVDVDADANTNGGTFTPPSFSPLLDIEWLHLFRCILYHHAEENASRQGGDSSTGTTTTNREESGLVPPDVVLPCLNISSFVDQHGLSLLPPFSAASTAGSPSTRSSSGQNIVGDDQSQEQQCRPSPSKIMLYILRQYSDHYHCDLFHPSTEQDDDGLSWMTHEFLFDGYSIPLTDNVRSESASTASKSVIPLIRHPILIDAIELGADIEIIYHLLECGVSPTLCDNRKQTTTLYISPPAALLKHTLFDMLPSNQQSGTPSSTTASDAHELWAPRFQYMRDILDLLIDNEYLPDKFSPSVYPRHPTLPNDPIIAISLPHLQQKLLGSFGPPHFDGDLTRSDNAARCSDEPDTTPNLKVSSFVVHRCEAENLLYPFFVSDYTGVIELPSFRKSLCELVDNVLFPFMKLDESRLSMYSSCQCDSQRFPLLHSPLSCATHTDNNQQTSTGASISSNDLCIQLQLAGMSSNDTSILRLGQQTLSVQALMLFVTAQQIDGIVTPFYSEDEISDLFQKISPSTDFTECIYNTRFYAIPEIDAFIHSLPYGMDMDIVLSTHDVVLHTMISYMTTLPSLMSHKSTSEVYRYILKHSDLFQTVPRFTLSFNPYLSSSSRKSTDLNALNQCIDHICSKFNSQTRDIHTQLAKTPSTPQPNSTSVSEYICTYSLPLFCALTTLVSSSHPKNNPKHAARSEDVWVDHIQLMIPMLTTQQKQHVSECLTSQVSDCIVATLLHPTMTTQHTLLSAICTRGYHVGSPLLSGEPLHDGEWDHQDITHLQSILYPSQPVKTLHASYFSYFPPQQYFTYCIDRVLYIHKYDLSYTIMRAHFASGVLPHALIASYPSSFLGVCPEEDVDELSNYSQHLFQPAKAAIPKMYIDFDHEQGDIMDSYQPSPYLQSPANRPRYHWATTIPSTFNDMLIPKSTHFIYQSLADLSSSLLFYVCVGPSSSVKSLGFILENNVVLKHGTATTTLLKYNVADNTPSMKCVNSLLVYECFQVVPGFLQMLFKWDFASIAPTSEEDICHFRHPYSKFTLAYWFLKYYKCSTKMRECLQYIPKYTLDFHSSFKNDPPMDEYGLPQHCAMALFNALLVWSPQEILFRQWRMIHRNLISKRVALCLNQQTGQFFTQMQEINSSLDTISKLCLKSYRDIPPLTADSFYWILDRGFNVGNLDELALYVPTAAHNLSIHRAATSIQMAPPASLSGYSYKYANELIRFNAKNCNAAEGILLRFTSSFHHGDYKNKRNDYEYLLQEVMEEYYDYAPYGILIGLLRNNICPMQGSFNALYYASIPLKHPDDSQLPEKLFSELSRCGKSYTTQDHIATQRFILQLYTKHESHLLIESLIHGIGTKSRLSDDPTVQRYLLPDDDPSTWDFSPPYADRHKNTYFFRLFDTSTKNAEKIYPILLQVYRVPRQYLLYMLPFYTPEFLDKNSQYFTQFYWSPQTVRSYLNRIPIPSDMHQELAKIDPTQQVLNQNDLVKYVKQFQTANKITVMHGVDFRHLWASGDKTVGLKTLFGSPTEAIRFLACFYHVPVKTTSKESIGILASGKPEMMQHKLVSHYQTATTFWQLFSIQAAKILIPLDSQFDQDDKNQSVSYSSFNTFPSLSDPSDNGPDHEFNLVTYMFRFYCTYARMQTGQYSTVLFNFIQKSVFSPEVIECLAALGDEYFEGRDSLTIYIHINDVLEYHLQSDSNRSKDRPSSIFKGPLLFNRPSFFSPFVSAADFPHPHPMWNRTIYASSIGDIFAATHRKYEFEIPNPPPNMLKRYRFKQDPVPRQYAFMMYCFLLHANLASPPNKSAITGISIRPPLLNTLALHPLVTRQIVVAYRLKLSMYQTTYKPADLRKVEASSLYLLCYRTSPDKYFWAIDALGSLCQDVFMEGDIEMNALTRLTMMDNSDACISRLTQQRGLFTSVQKGLLQKYCKPEYYYLFDKSSQKWADE